MINPLFSQMTKGGFVAFHFIILVPYISLAQTPISINSAVGNVTEYQNTFVGDGNSVDVDTRTITVNATVSLSDGANLILEEGWTLNADDFIIDTGIDSSTPADIEDLSNYTFAMKQGSRLNITAVSGSNKIKSGRVYVDSATLAYTKSSGQYQFGSFNTDHNTFYYVKHISLLSNGAGRLLLQFNRATADSVFEGATFLGVGKTEMNAIFGADTSNVKPQSRYETVIGVENAQFSDKVGGEDGNNWTYFKDWIFEDYGVANAPGFAPRNDVNISFIDPDLQGNQSVRMLGSLPGTITFSGAWIDIRRSFTPKFVDGSGNPLADVKMMISSAAANFRWFEGGGRTRGTSGG